MKLTLTIVLSFFILVGSMTNAITYVSFKINQKEIAKTLCVLRQKANNTCNGICVLNAKIKELNELEKKHSNSVSEKQEIVYIFTTADFLISTPILFFKKQIVDFLPSKNPITISYSSFRPPIV